MPHDRAECSDPNQPKPVGRLAPSPTGAQHVGNARTYLLAWLSIRARGGRVILRIEDIDSPRVKSWAADQALEDLKWLGLDWDEGPDVGGAHAPYVQTQRMPLYRQALQQLTAAERVYPCTCSRADVAAAASAPHGSDEIAVYPGTCASRRAADHPSIQPRPFSWRFRTSDNTREFVDVFAGPKSSRPAEELGDFVIGKPDGTPAYQLAVVVDDHSMGVTEVLRGDDLIPSTFRQLELFDFFGWPSPEFIHVPLVVGPDGRRLAKRHGDTRLSVLREHRVPAERLIGLLAWSCGLRPDTSPVAAHELLDNFDIRRIPPQPFVFTEAMWKSLISSQ